MSDEEIAAEQERGRAIGLISLGTVLAFGIGFFALWLVQKDAAKGGGDVSSLLLINEHSGAFIISYFFFAIGSLLVAPVLVHLALAVRSRRPMSPKLLLIVAFAGPLLVALALPAYTLVQVSVAGNFADGTVQTAAEAKKLLDDTGPQLTGLLYQFADLIFAIAWVMVALYAMRAGLLTRLTGYVALAIGVSSILAPPLAAILQVFWIGSFAILLLGRSQQRPPAWVMGRAVPWSEVKQLGLDQQLRENPDEFAKSSGSSNGTAEAPAIDAPPADEN